MSSFLAISAMMAATQVFRLEVDDSTQSVWIVGVDGEKRAVCLVDPAEYAMLTGRVDQVWQSLNATEDGRVKLHGTRYAQIIDEEFGEKVTVYRDGFRYTEKMWKKALSSPVSRLSTSDAARTPRLRGGSVAHRKFLEELRERKARGKKTITVEHDAVTGKDEVK